MKTKKLLAMVLAVLMIFSSISALSLIASAETTTYSKDIEITSPELLVGSNISTFLSSITVGDSTNLSIVDSWITLNNTDQIVEGDIISEPYAYTLNMILELTNTTDYSHFDSTGSIYSGKVKYDGNGAQVINSSIGTASSFDTSSRYIGASSSDALYLYICQTLSLRREVICTQTVSSIAPMLAETTTVATNVDIKNFVDQVTTPVYSVTIFDTNYDEVENPDFQVSIDSGELKVTTTSNTGTGNYILNIKATVGEGEKQEVGYYNGKFDIIQYLDLEDDATYSDTKDDIAQNYTITDSSSYTGKTKVKLTWTVTDIDVTIQDDQVWNPDKLQWESTNNATASATDGSATFNLDNMSSEEVYAKASFAVEDSLKSTFDKATFDKKSVKLLTVVDKDNNVDKSVDTTGTITATIEVKDAEFKGMSATTQATKYGTYTVTISNTDPYPTKKTVKATINSTEVDRTGVQLWEDGPFWAEFNVGATIDSYNGVTLDSSKFSTGTVLSNVTTADMIDLNSKVGNYFPWGATTNYVNNANPVVESFQDTATAIWGSNWKMPTKSQLEDLIDSNKTTCVWCNGSTTKYADNCTLPGLKISGKGDYANNSIFLPATGALVNGSMYYVGTMGYYWTLTPNGVDKSYDLAINNSQKAVSYVNNYYGQSVRAIIAEAE